MNVVLDSKRLHDIGDRNLSAGCVWLMSSFGRAFLVNSVL